MGITNAAVGIKIGGITAGIKSYELLVKNYFEQKF